MSAEKEIVNYWCNKKGYFTINHLKTGSNKEIGILAFDTQNMKILHIQVSCSITNNDADEKSISKLIEEKFEDTAISKLVKMQIKNLPFENVQRVIVMNSFSKSRKTAIEGVFADKNIKIEMFEDILFDVFECLDTQYHKNDIIRTMQLTKFLLFSQPEKMATLLSERMICGSRKEFLESILKNEDIIKEFRKTNSQRLGTILKNSGIKANELAQILGNEILTSRNRKTFLDSMMQQEESIKIVNKTNKIKKKNMALGKFF